MAKPYYTRTNAELVAWGNNASTLLTDDPAASSSLALPAPLRAA